MSEFRSAGRAGRIRREKAPAVSEDVVATVLEIIVAAWPQVCTTGISSTTSEDAITDKLRWEMVAEKRRRHPPPAMRFEREAQRDDPDRLFATGFVDIFVTYSDDENVYFAVECKKVNDCHETPAKKYIEEGVCRFSSGKYSPNHPFGAMVGYVTEGTIESTAEFVGERIVAFDKNATGLVAKWGWKSETRFGAVPSLHSTQHRQLKTKNTILLVHLFVPFPAPK